MFLKTDTQRSLLECEFLLPKEKAERLKKSWAEPFRALILPMIDEEPFRNAFHENNGRPNASIRLLVGIHLLKEWNDLTDEQVLDQLEYNLQWHYALGIDSEVAHLCQKTLHNFRVKLMANDRAKLLFEQVTRAIAETDRLKLGKQRLDSTHVLSNIAVLTRLGLFVETATHFLKDLRKEEPESFESLDSGYARRYLDREGYFSDAKKEQARRRLSIVAHDIYGLVSTFESDAVVCEMSSFKLLMRLFEEQCEVVTGHDDEDEKSDENNGTDRVRVKLSEPKTISGNSLQSPYDPDATYGHKGKGYEVQLSETCDNDNPYQVITGTHVNGAHESDQKAVLPMLAQLEESEMLPDELLADTGYGSGENIVEAAKQGVDLQAPVQDPDAPSRKDHFAAPVDEESDNEKPSESKALDSSISPEGSDNAPITLGSFSFNSTFDRVISCPAGKSPKFQKVTKGQLRAMFSSKHCSGCPLEKQCPLARLPRGDRQLRFALSTIATELRQHEQQTPEFKERYKKRSGIESTNHELKGRHGLNRLRIRGRPRVSLSVMLKSLALNVKRSVEYHVHQMPSVVPSPC
jgi:IS5 family transposase